MAEFIDIETYKELKKCLDKVRKQTKKPTKKDEVRNRMRIYNYRFQTMEELLSRSEEKNK